MVAVKIDPVEFKTKGGHTAQVTSLALFDPDPYRGTIQVGEHEPKVQSWRSNGMARDAHPNFNLLVNEPDFDEVRKAAEHLRRGAAG